MGLGPQQTRRASPTRPPRRPEQVQPERRSRRWTGAARTAAKPSRPGKPRQGSVGAYAHLTHLYVHSRSIPKPHPRSPLRGQSHCGVIQPRSKTHRIADGQSPGFQFGHSLLFQREPEREPTVGVDRAVEHPVRWQPRFMISFRIAESSASVSRPDSFLSCSRAFSFFAMSLLIECLVLTCLPVLIRVDLISDGPCFFGKSSLVRSKTGTA